MNEIKCPECGKVFSVDEASYASVVNQIRTKEFEEEIRRRVAEIEKQQQLKQQSDKLISEQAFQQKLNAKNQEIEKRNADIARLEEQVKSVAISKQAEFEKLLSGGDAAESPSAPDSFEENEYAGEAYDEGDSFSSDPRSDWKRRAGNVNMNDLQTPAALRRKSGYSRTINFNRNK